MLVTDYLHSKRRQNGEKVIKIKILQSPKSRVPVKFRSKSFW